MLKTLVLSNFQSHKKSTLEFDQGVNCIIGQSNSGKTSLLRALLWVLRNRPSGQEFVSHWNQDNKGNPIKSTYASIERAGIVINRIRSGELNGYKILENERTPERILEAIGMDVPAEIVSFFNMEEVNIQQQMDAPFLLSESSAEVARFFNRTIRLDIIDSTLSKAEARRRQYMGDKKRAEADLKELTEQLASFDWVDEASSLLDRLEKIEARQEADLLKQSKLEDSIDDEGAFRAIITDSSNILSAASPLIDKIQAAQDAISERTRRIDRLENSFDEYSEQLEILDSLSSIDIDVSLELINKIGTIYGKIELDQKKLEKLEMMALDYQDEKANITNAEASLAELEKSLPDTCPLCGAKMRRDK